MEHAITEKDSEKLVSQGFVIAPFGYDKKGSVFGLKGWTKLEPEPPAKLFQRFRAEFGSMPDAIGVLTGAELGSFGRYLAVVDVDDPDGLEAVRKALPPTLEAIPSKGGHFYLSTEKTFESFVYDGPKGRAIDVFSLRRDGGHANVICPPSPHRKTGKLYRWIDEKAPIAEISAADLRAALDSVASARGYTNKARRPETPAPDSVRGVPDGARAGRDPILEEIKARVTLFDLGLRSGSGQDCPLPGHATPHGHLSVTADGRGFACFERHGTGDVFSWVMLRDSCDFPTAKRALLARSGIKTNSPNTPNGFGAKFNDVGHKVAPNTPNAPGQNGFIYTKTPPPYRVVFCESMPKIEAYRLGSVPAELLKPPEWHLKDLIPKSGKVFLGAPVAEYKSTLALYFAVYLAAGKPIYNGACSKPVPVWYIDEEDTFGHIYEVAQSIKAGLDDEGKKKAEENLILSSGQGINTERAEALLTKIRELRPDVVFVDTFRKLATGDENESHFVNLVDNVLLAPATNELGLTWVILHHTVKRSPKDPRTPDNFELLRGSGAIAGVATTVMMLEKLKVDNLALYLSKNKWGKQSGRLLYIHRPPGSLLVEDGGELEVGLAAAGKLAEQIIQALLKDGIFEGIKTKDITGKFERSGSMDRAIGILKNRGVLVGTGKQNRSPFRFVPPQRKLENGAE